MSDQLELARLARVVRGDLVNRYRSLLVIAAAIAAVMVLHALLFQPLQAERDLVYSVALGLILFLWGPIAASRSFLELHDKKRNEAWLLLPASALEKVASRLLLVTILFVPFVLVLMTVIPLLISGLKAALFGAPEAFYWPGANLLGLDRLGIFFMQQSMFFLGAAWFRKNHFVKTGLAITLLSIGLIWFFAIFARIVLPDLGTTWLSVEMGPLVGRLGDSLGTLAWLARVLGYVVLPIFCWVVAWLRVRETQVSYGI